MKLLVTSAMTRISELIIVATLLATLVGCSFGTEPAPGAIPSLSATRIIESATSLPDPTATAARHDQTVHTVELETGDCVASDLSAALELEIAEVQLTRCDGKWAYKVLHKYESDGSGDYPGAERLLAESMAECPRQTSFILYPPESHWLMGVGDVVCFQESFGLSDTEPRRLDRMVRATSIAPQECAVLVPGTGYDMAELVSCAEQWELKGGPSFEIEHDGPFPGEGLIADQFATKCGRLYLMASHPSAETWSLGDRRLTCIRVNFHLSKRTVDQLPRVVTAASLREGECFNDIEWTGDELVELVSCSEPAQFYVLSSGPGGVAVAPHQIADVTPVNPLENSGDR